MQQFILILGMVSLFLDWYAYQGFKRLTANTKTNGRRRTIRGVYWLFSIGLIATFAVTFYLRFATEQIYPFMKWVISAFLTFFVTKLVFVLVLFGEDIVRGVVAFWRLLQPRRTTSAKPLVPARRKAVSQLALLLAAIPFGGFVYGVFKGKYNYTVHRHTLYFDDLPAAFDGFTITQISDVHSGSFDNAEAVQRGIDLVKAQKSDLFVFTGDLVNDRALEIEPYIQQFKQIKAPFGQFSILGNHDYGMYAEWSSEAAQQANMEKLKQHHAELGYRLLLDEHVVLEKDGEQLTLLGVENWGRGFIELGDLDQALEGVNQNAFKVLLSHDPSHWDEVVKTHSSLIHLTLAGHTHGMQFGVETPLFKWSPVQYRYKNWAGLAQENGRHLYVNRGFGFIGFSGRVGIWPEITVLELKKGKPSPKNNA